MASIINTLIFLLKNFKTTLFKTFYLKVQDLPGVPEFNRDNMWPENSALYFQSFQNELFGCLVLFSISSFWQIQCYVSEALKEVTA